MYIRIEPYLGVLHLKLTREQNMYIKIEPYLSLSVLQLKLTPLHATSHEHIFLFMPSIEAKPMHACYVHPGTILLISGIPCICMTRYVNLAHRSLGARVLRV